MNRNIYLYWIGNDYSLIRILRNLIYKYSRYGQGFHVHLINHNNLSHYISLDDLPQCFYELLPAHQADVVRVYVVEKYGGIWLDSDILVLESLDSIFELIENKDGLFIKEDANMLYNGMFASRPHTPLMIEWKNRMINILHNKKTKIHWTEIGNSLLDQIYIDHPEYFENYIIENGRDSVYPIIWNECVNEFIQKPYHNYVNITRFFQPFIILVNSVYKHFGNMSEEQILSQNMPLNYFLNIAINNMPLQQLLKLSQNNEYYQMIRSEEFRNKLNR
jgi:hypothetical protein